MSEGGSKVKKHHDVMPISAFPALEECINFEPGGDEIVNKDAEQGREAHEAFRMIVENRYDEDVYGYPPEDIVWAAETLSKFAGMDAEPECERRIHIRDEDGFILLTFGTCDYMRQLEKKKILIADLKTGWDQAKNYKLQVIGYAYGAMQEMGFTRAKICILHTKFRDMEEFEVTRGEAKKKVMALIDKKSDPPAEYNPNEFCSFCRIRHRCPATTKIAIRAAVNRDDFNPRYDLKEYHPSEITDPRQMAKALELARFLKYTFADSVEHHARLMMEEQGLPGYKWRVFDGQPSVDDRKKMYELLNVPSEDFLSFFDFNWSRAVEYFKKDYPNYSNTQIKKMLMKRLESVLVPGQEVRQIVKDKSWRDTNA